MATDVPASSPGKCQPWVSLKPGLSDPELLLSRISIAAGQLLWYLLLSSG